MMKLYRFILNSLFLIAVIVYLFITAPAALTVSKPEKDAVIEIEKVFLLLKNENERVRALWTDAIVRDGKKAGFKFSEDWRLKSVEAGPLPALFLREIARNMERSPLRLSLFLGSDFPINSANRFSGDQLAKYQLLKASLQPQIYQAQDTALYTAMFADMAISQACIDCHNNHQDSPKKDWRLQETMGATTWLYPKSHVSLKECLQLLALFRDSVRQAYTRYLEKSKTFKDPPIIGERWPEQGNYLPDSQTFMTAVTAQTSGASLSALFDFVSDSGKDGGS